MVYKTYTTSKCRFMTILIEGTRIGNPVRRDFPLLGWKILDLKKYILDHFTKGEYDIQYLANPVWFNIEII